MTVYGTCAACSDPITEHRGANAIQLGQYGDEFVPPTRDGPSHPRDGIPLTVPLCARCARHFRAMWPDLDAFGRWIAETVRTKVEEAEGPLDPVVATEYPSGRAIRRSETPWRPA